LAAAIAIAVNAGGPFSLHLGSSRRLEKGHHMELLHEIINLKSFFIKRSGMVL
jgi:hypothetical protein